MSYVYGRMKISITGTMAELAKASCILRTCESGRNFKDWFLRGFDSAIRGAKPVARQRLKATVDEFWDEATPVAELMIELGRKMPELEIRMVCNVAHSVSDSKVRFTVQKNRDAMSWSCPTWLDVKMAGSMLQVEFPKGAKTGYS